jgi:hypothetical protein
MKAGYTKLPDRTRAEGYSYYPLLNVALKYGSLNTCSVTALVDSGSLDCIFPASVGQVLGIDVESGTSHQFGNFNLQQTEGFVHRVFLQVTGFPHWIDVDVAFIPSEVVPILRQRDFFDNFQIVFERWRHGFEVNTIRRRNHPKSAGPWPCALVH